MDTSTLLRFRKVTRAIAANFFDELTRHIATLTPLLNPRLVLGPHVSGTAKAASRGADQALEELQEQYAAVRNTEPFNLRERFDVPIDIMSAIPSLTAVEYVHVLRVGDVQKAVTITSPLQWVLSYKGYEPTRLRELLARQTDAQGSDLRQHVVHQLVMQTVLQHNTGVQHMLDALRLPLSMKSLTGFGELTFPVISTPLETTLPPDEVVFENTEISGTAKFEEVVDPDAVEHIDDLLKARLNEIVRYST